MSQIGIEGVTVNADSGPYFSDEFKSEGAEAVITVDLTHLRGGPTVSFVLQHRTASRAFSDAGTITLTSTGPASMYINQIKPICRWRVDLAGTTGDSASLTIGSMGWFKTKECCGGCGGTGDCHSTSTATTHLGGDATRAERSAHALYWGALQAEDSHSDFWAVSTVALFYNRAAETGLMDEQVSGALRQIHLVASGAKTTLMFAQAGQQHPPPHQWEPPKPGDACCPDKIEFDAKGASTGCKGRVTVKVKAIWKGTGRNEAGQPCNCSCCEARQCISMSAMTTVPGGATANLDLNALLNGEGAIWERAGPNESYQDNKDSEWFKIFLAINMPMTIWDPRGGVRGRGGFTYVRRSEPIMRDVVVPHPRGNMSPFFVQDVMRDPARRNRAQVRRDLTQKFKGFGIKGHLGTKVEKEKGKCWAKWTDHIEATEPNRKKGSTADFSVTLTVLIRPKGCQGVKKEEKCSIGIHAARMVENGPCNITADLC